MTGLVQRRPWMAVVALAVALSACGGAFSSPDGSGGSGGSVGNAGSGGSPGHTPKGCSFNGQTYEDGASFPSDDGCNTCSCSDGAVGCTLRGCPVGPVCADIESRYATALDQAKSCDPNQQAQCSHLIPLGLICGCEAFVNPEHAEAIAAAEAAQRDYADGQCGGDVLCGACAPASSAYCSPEGRCETVTDIGGGTVSCMVGGVVYPSGAGNIPDPVSCNTCQCSDGQLGCTEIGCPKPCPPDSVYGTQCAQCGPADGCEVVEHACLPVCTDVCESGACVDGICRSLCG